MLLLLLLLVLAPDVGDPPCGTSRSPAIPESIDSLAVSLLPVCFKVTTDGVAREDEGISMAEGEQIQRSV